jgi:FkbM family methyltransferase
LAHGEPEIHLLSNFVTPGTAVVDIGAHSGAYSAVLARLVGRRGRVICIEPLPDLAKRLRRGGKQLRLPLHVEQCALAAENGESDLHIPVVGDRVQRGFASLHPHGAERYIDIRVPLRRLDDVVADELRQITFIKIDVEGAELDVLRGAMTTLRRYRPALLIEIEQRHSTGPITDTFSFVESLGYGGTFLDQEGNLRSVSEFIPNIHQRRDVNVWSSKYVNNFIFVPKDHTPMGLGSRT